MMRDRISICRSAGEGGNGSRSDSDEKNGRHFAETRERKGGIFRAGGGGMQSGLTIDRSRHTHLTGKTSASTITSDCGGGGEKDKRKETIISRGKKERICMRTGKPKNRRNTIAYGGNVRSRGQRGESSAQLGGRGGERRKRKKILHLTEEGMWGSTS